MGVITISMSAPAHSINQSGKQHFQGGGNHERFSQNRGVDKLAVLGQGGRSPNAR
jgi:hypothetical protein